MMDLMVADLDKEITETEVEEKEAQAEYEQFMKDEEEKTATMKEAMATHEFLAEVHADCDWLLTNFETRKAARAGEIDAMTKAKAVLSGADYSLIQRAEIRHHM